MQKKLLLLCMIVNCLIHAGENETVNQKDYTEYRKQQEAAYHAALINALSNKENAIDEEDQKNQQANNDEAKTTEQANKQEEESKRNGYYDGGVGYWGSQPTIRSEVGRKFEKYAQERIRKNLENDARKEKKNEIWLDISKEAVKQRNTFNEKVLPEMQRKLESKRFFIYEDRLPALKECREDLPCYGDDGLSSTIFTNPHFGMAYEMKLYKSLIAFSMKQGVPLTLEEIRAIAEYNPKTKEFFKGVQEGIKDISDLREQIVNPQKQEVQEINLDIKEDQNNQGALSQ